MCHFPAKKISLLFCTTSTDQNREIWAIPSLKTERQTVMIQVHDTLSSRMLGRPLSYILLLPGEGHTARRLLTLLHGAEEGPEILLENSGLADTLPPDLADRKSVV